MPEVAAVISSFSTVSREEQTMRKPRGRETEKRRRKRERQLTERGEFLIFSDLTIMSQPAQEDEQIQRPEVREEDVTEARNRLGFSGPAKSKTFEVMEECEKAGKAAPSVFSRARSGAETVLNTRSTPK
uniref:Musculoskeletal embryonic nuclear protein 1 n=1 Tax=Amphiprion ocellaris TaxID=80972 RepID=A0AAQ5ZAD1_AMPOC